MSNETSKEEGNHELKVDPKEHQFESQESTGHTEADPKEHQFEGRESAEHSAEHNETPGAIDEIEQSEHTETDTNTQMDALKVENNQLKDSALRAQAEMQNIRQRAQKDVEKARKYALEKFVNALLPVADNLERALDAADKKNDTQKDVIEGVELTLKSFQDTLKQFGVEAIDPQDEPFNPQRHQAMSTAPNANVEPNTVLTVFQKGYLLNDRLVRPAMVVVSSTPEDIQK